MTTAATTFTPEQVAEFGEMIRPFLPHGMTPEASVAVAVDEARASEAEFFTRFFGGDYRFKRAVLGALGGTYDEFRAEVAS